MAAGLTNGERRRGAVAFADGDAEGNAARYEEEVRFWLPWCRCLPKVELHAHLNGSVRSSTLLELAIGLSKKGLVNLPELQAIIVNSDRSLAECFKLFDMIHLLTTDHKIITRISKEVIEDFAAENVVYLELRTTPKCNTSIGMTKRSYVEAVLAGLRAVETVQVISSNFETSQTVVEDKGTKPNIYVKLILCIDRHESTEAAIDTVQLALQMQRFGIVGIDLSGNPHFGDWKTFVPAFNLAKEQGLPITLHCGEVPNPLEVQNMLSFKPERIGHGCCLEDAALATLLQSKIPVEVCLTSNNRTEAVRYIPDHCFGVLYKSSHPLIICTDDPRIFGTDISREYALAAVCFGLSKENIQQLAKNAVKHIFAGDDIKAEVGKNFDATT